MNIKQLVNNYFSCSLFYYDLDPCAEKQCNGTNAICKVFFGTGEPFCACPLGYKGNPERTCGKYFLQLMNQNTQGFFNRSIYSKVLFLFHIFTSIAVDYENIFVHTHITSKTSDNHCTKVSGKGIS